MHFAALFQTHFEHSVVGQTQLDTLNTICYKPVIDLE